MSPQAPCPRHAPHGTPRDLTLPLPAVRVQPQCSKRGAMPALALVRAGGTAALCEARVHNPRRGVAQAFHIVTLSANWDPISLDIRDASRHDWSISNLSLQTSQSSLISCLRLLRHITYRG